MAKYAAAAVYRTFKIQCTVVKTPIDEHDEIIAKTLAQHPPVRTEHSHPIYAEPTGWDIVIPDGVTGDLRTAVEAFIYAWSVGFEDTRLAIRLEHFPP